MSRLCRQQLPLDRVDLLKFPEQITDSLELKLGSPKTYKKMQTLVCALHTGLDITSEFP